MKQFAALTGPRCGALNVERWISNGLFALFAGSPPVTFPIPLRLLSMVRAHFVDRLPFPRNFSFPYPLLETCVPVGNRAEAAECWPVRAEAKGPEQELERQLPAGEPTSGPVEFPRYLICRTGLGRCFASPCVARKPKARVCVVHGMTGSRCWPPGRTSLLWRTGWKPSDVWRFLPGLLPQPRWYQRLQISAGGVFPDSGIPRSRMKLHKESCANRAMRASTNAKGGKGLVPALVQHLCQGSVQ